MSLGRSPNQEDLHRSTRAACEAALAVAKQAGLVGRKRVVDATLDTEVRTVLRRHDDYKDGKRVCDWEDETAREALVNALARHGHKTQ